MADGEDSDQAGFAILFVNDAKTPDFDAPQPGQFSDQRPLIRPRPAKTNAGSEVA